MDNTTNNRTIAKNTVILYIRMISVMLISLYTSRVVLATLGVEDFGIYSVVGGIVAVMAFLNSALSAASQRFISYELGRGDEENLNNIFSSSISVHVLLSIICVIIFESVGIWFLNTHMNIDASRMMAANWVFQCSIVTFVINVISVPYNALIIAHEKMGVYAYISIVEVVLKLIIVLFLTVVDYDKLIIYAIFQLIVAFLIRCCYTIYCRRNFVESRLKLVLDKDLIKKLFSFSGWSVVGNVGFTLKDPLLNIILNLFFGPAINAAKGIATQVNAVVNSFATNFGMAMNPQIVKRYAAGDIKGSMDLVYYGSRLSFYLIMLISIPIIVNVDCILNLWLKDVPEYTNIFLVITILATLIYSLSGTSSVAVQATGKIRGFSIGVCIIPILDLPIAYILLYLGYPPYIALIPSIFTNFIALLFRFYILKSLVNQYSWRYFIVNIVLRSFITFIVAITLCYSIDYCIDKSHLNDFFLTCLSLALCCGITAFCILYIGLSHSERGKIVSQFYTTILHKIRKSNYNEI